MRWVIRLQPYDYKITHRPGKDNGYADELSRQAWEEDERPDALHGEKGWRSSNPEEPQQEKQNRVGDLPTQKSSNNNN